MDSKKILDSLYYRFEPSSQQIIFQSNLGLKQEDILLIVNMNKNQFKY